MRSPRIDRAVRPEHAPDIGVVLPTRVGVAQSHVKAPEASARFALEFLGVDADHLGRTGHRRRGGGEGEDRPGGGGGGGGETMADALEVHVGSLEHAKRYAGRGLDAAEVPAVIEPSHRG